MRKSFDILAMRPHCRCYVPANASEGAAMGHRFRGQSTAVLVLVGVTACSAAPDDATPSAREVPATDAVVLTVANYAGLPLDELLRDFQGTHPEVVVEITGVPVGAAATRPSLLDDLQATDLADVVLVSDGDLPSVFANPDRFSDLAAATRAADRLPWAAERGVDDQGRVLAVPVTTEPAALCFRHDLLAASGIASGRDDLASLLGGDGATWATYFDVGRRYHAATGQAWFDQPEMIWRAMVSQLPPSSSADLDAPDSELRDRWDLLAAALADGLSAGAEAWDWDGGRAFVDGSFATFPCPHWAIDLVEANTTAGGGDAGTGWDVADVFPGGGWSWAGVYASRSSRSAHPDEASTLVAWLTAPEQQARYYSAGIGVPSDTRAVGALAQDGGADAFLNDAPVAAIVASRAQRMAPGGGMDGMGAAELQSVLDASLLPLHQLDSGEVDGATAWADAAASLAEAHPSPLRTGDP